MDRARVDREEYVIVFVYIIPKAMLGQRMSATSAPHCSKSVAGPKQVLEETPDSGIRYLDN